MTILTLCLTLLLPQTAPADALKDGFSIGASVLLVPADRLRIVKP